MNYKKQGFGVLLSLILVGFIGCKHEQIPNKVLAQADFRPQLPQGVQAPSQDKAEQHQQEIQIGDPVAKVLIRWTTFKQGQDSYILSGEIEGPESTEKTQLTAWFHPPTELFPKGAPFNQRMVSIQWTHQLLGTDIRTIHGAINADGNWVESKAEDVVEQKPAL